MPYFKDTQNKLHFLEDSSFSYLLPPDVVSISDEEALEIQTIVPTPTIDDQIAEVKSQFTTTIQKILQLHKLFMHKLKHWRRKKMSNNLLCD